MAGLEVVVRPVVFPNIRPTPAQSLPPADDPDKGFAVIRGNGAKQIDLSNSYSNSTSTSQKTETKRRSDEVRVYQQEDDGTVNKENFVDIKVANKIWMRGASEPAADPGGKPGKTNYIPEVIPYNYAKAKPKANVEILDVDIIETNKP